MPDHASGLLLPKTSGPTVAFAVTVLPTLALLTLVPAPIPQQLIMPVISSMFFLFAALLGLIAWRVRPVQDRDTVTYWDVAGALTVFGIFSGMLIEPDQLVRLVESQRDTQ